jgi:hypothetical protein
VQAQSITTVKTAMLLHMPTETDLDFTIITLP